jgi:pimeloyl-ACP methyl ester carboxylesterase
MRTEKYITTNNITLHCVDFEGGEPTIVLTHGLTANAHCFVEIVKAGLSPKFRVISVDLRGRGLSDKPESGYSMAEHAKDIVGLLDQLDLQQVVLGGHSFGALLTIYIASHYPDRVSKMILIDAAVKMHPDTRQMVEPALKRLGQKVPSFDDYIDNLKKAPYLLGRWDPALIEYYRADVKTNEDGSVQSHSRPENMLEAIDGALSEDWAQYVKEIDQPGILINALGSYGLPGAPPILPKELALETVNTLKDCKYVEVPGNHLTMLFSDGAQSMAQEITNFITGSKN